MKDYTYYAINNTSSKAKTLNNKNILIESIYNKIGVRLSNSLTIKQLKEVLNG